jgi:RNA polymerase sigma-70 factor (ECF subfamily)
MSTAYANPAARADFANDEAELVARAARRDPAAIRTIVQRYNRRLYRVARSVLRDDWEAEDALQSAYVRAFGAIGEFRGDSALATWLTRIVLNEALGRLRIARREIATDFTETSASATPGKVIPFPAVSTDADPEKAVAQRQIQTALERAIDELPVAFRTVLVARILEEMSVEETASLLALRPETVKTRLHRARRLLREALERQIGPVLVDAFPFAGRRCARLTDEVLRRLGLE